ncbi:MAG: GGDEF domain-containing protein [Pseudomonadota bacterium]
MSDNWKEKYLNKLEQFDNKQKEWSNLEEFLRQTSSRLALAAEGSSKLLDKNLLVLRKAIRKGESQSKLTSIMDVVSKELVRLDKQKSKKPKGHAGFLDTLVNDLSLSPEMDKKSKSIKKLLKAKNPPEDDLLAKEFSLFFNHCVSISFKNGLSGIDENSQHQKQGFFGRFFGSKNDVLENNSNDDNISQQDKPISHTETTDKNSNIAAEGDQILSHLSYEKRQEIEKSVTESLHNILDSFVDSLDYPEEQKNLLKEKLFSIKPTKEVHVLLGDLAQMIRANDDETEESGKSKVTAEAHEILIRLLESIPMQENIQKQAEILKKKFSSGISQAELPGALDSIAHLISLMQKETNQDSKQFEEFLLNMTGRLKEVDQFLTDNLKEHKDSWEKGVALGNSVKKHVQEIGQNVSKASDLSQLEKTIQSSLDSIIENVEEHRQNENARVKRIQQQNQSLQNKIKHLENESGELRNKVISTHEKAYTDPLTSLPNRLSYDQHLEEQYAHWQRYHENLLLMIWDIDYFKKVNDNYGHQAGDEVLKMVAKLLREHLRKPDFIARFGGEEFVSLLPNTSLGGGYKVAEKMRSAIQELEFTYKEQTIPLTISCGISLFAVGDSPADVFERADKALYQAKKQGRNRCVIAQD